MAHEGMANTRLGMGGGEKPSMSKKRHRFHETPGPRHDTSGASVYHNSKRWKSEMHEDQTAKVGVRKRSHGSRPLTAEHASFPITMERRSQRCCVQSAWSLFTSAAHAVIYSCLNRLCFQHVKHIQIMILS